MGFPVSYPEVMFPKPFLRALAFLGLIRSLLLALFDRLGLADFFENDVPPPLSTRVSPKAPASAALLIRERLPVVKFEDVAGGVPAQESCAVCLYDFEGGAEVRWLPNCRHIFHCHCVDRWMDLDQRTCPLCRTPFVDGLDQRLWAASASYTGAPDLYDILD